MEINLGDIVELKDSRWAWIITIDNESHLYPYEVYILNMKKVIPLWVGKGDIKGIIKSFE